ncbi:MAG: glycosyltransferase family 4 protein [Bryobacteraceae bacterium]
MRFSVDAHAIGRHLTGNEVYIRNLLAGFAALDRKSEFIAYITADGQATTSGAVPERFVQRQIAGNSVLRLGFDLSRQLRRDRPDLVHVQYTAPLACPVPVVVSVHDISYLEHPEFFPLYRTLQLGVTVKRTVHAAAVVITPSEFSRQCVMQAYGLEESRVVFIPNAVSSAFRPISQESAAGYVRARFDFPMPFVLTVGDLQPRKNQIGLIRAFEHLVRENPRLPHHLIIVGQKTWFANRIVKAAQASPAAERIHFTEWIGDDDLVQFYNACDLFVFPSFYEGFGMPILEAMACGRAVACSNRSAMPEVANAAALLFNPDSVEEMARAMRDVLLDPELRGRMERLGQSRASLFTWERSAQRTLEVYHQVALKRQIAEAVSVSRP